MVQPTDYIVSLMVRQGLLQKLDKSKLPVLKYFDPNYLNLPFDPNNEYTIPYQAGMDAIVYNGDRIKDPPKSFADLWKPEFMDPKRMIVLRRLARHHWRHAADAGLRCQHHRRDAAGGG